MDIRTLEAYKRINKDLEELDDIPSTEKMGMARYSGHKVDDPTPLLLRIGVDSRDGTIEAINLHYLTFSDLIRIGRTLSDVFEVAEAPGTGYTKRRYDILRHRLNEMGMEEGLGGNYGEKVLHGRLKAYRSYAPEYLKSVVVYDIDKDKFLDIVRSVTKKRADKELPFDIDQLVDKEALDKLDVKFDDEVKEREEPEMTEKPDVAKEMDDLLEPEVEVSTKAIKEKPDIDVEIEDTPEEPEIDATLISKGHKPKINVREKKLKVYKRDAKLKSKIDKEFGDLDDLEETEPEVIKSEDVTYDVIYSDFSNLFRFLEDKLI